MTAGLREHLAYMTAVQVRANRRPSGGTPIFNPRYMHDFEPPEFVMVPSQCRHCWGWADDVRHR